MDLGGETNVGSICGLHFTAQGGGLSTPPLSSLCGGRSETLMSFDAGESLQRRQ
jgi:hypothetical protein